MVTLPGLVLFLCSIKQVTSYKPVWQSTNIPVVLPQTTLTLENPHFQGKAKLQVTSPCELECHQKAPLPTYEDLKEYLSYETLYLNGSRTLTNVGIYRVADDYSTDKGRTRTKRQIFGWDNRFSILGKDFLLKYPFSTSVKISTGCTGTLVAEKHVLTAAHCIHDGKSYVKGARKLKVGFVKPKQKESGKGRNQTTPFFPEKNKFHWIRVKRTHVPKGWIKGSANDIGMDYDYALLELKRAHKKPFMKIGVTPSRRRLPGGRIHFSGFDNDRPGDLVYRFCTVEEETYDLLYQQCDAQPGASGSGVYTRMWKRQNRKWERKVIGIFSGHQWVDKDGVQRDYNVAVRITPLKYAQICFWIKGNYMECRDG